MLKLFRNTGSFRKSCNEDLFIVKCLISVQAAAREASEAAGHIVVLNRCSGRTAEIAAQFGARVITEDSQGQEHRENGNHDIYSSADR